MGTSFCPVYSKSHPKAKERKCRWTGYPQIIPFDLCHSREKDRARFTVRNSNFKSKDLG